MHSSLLLQDTDGAKHALDLLLRISAASAPPLLLLNRVPEFLGDDVVGLTELDQGATEGALTAQYLGLAGTFNHRDVGMEEERGGVKDEAARRKLDRDAEVLEVEVVVLPRVE